MLFRSLSMVFLVFIAGLAQINSATAQEDNAVGAAQGLAAADVANIQINAVRLTASEERARLIVDLSAPTQFAFVSLLDPMSIAIDVRAGTMQLSEPLSTPQTGPIAEASISQVAADRVRTLLVLRSPMQVQQAYVLKAIDGQPARLVVDMVPRSEADFVAKAEADKANSTAQDGEPQLADNSNAPGTTEMEMAHRPLILIDPGHGGVDSGAVMANGIFEKTITLAFAKKLQEILIASGRFDVALTREDDHFVRLDERVDIARQNKASLFLSIHADAFDDHAIRGASIYTRDEQATDVLDKVLADGENHSAVLAGAVAEAPDAAAVDILVDLMRREMRRQAFKASTAIIDQLQASVPVRRFPLRRANFFVLQAPDVPSVLLELGFVSNDADARNLASPDWRDRTAEAVARGIAQYFDDGGGT
ncbi:MAG: N-acetylmuramoyl-L-alanine amidase [Hyphomicrobiaceae bacterium]|nr:N-acetylmuramoyl-L-alanine amidase [Hyphomicrobiaceae bacterium]MCC0023550.1 N-acetylmuramoyl-L-alanine amidase [Hyphomicrobiaceae bacterium]